MHTTPPTGPIRRHWWVVCAALLTGIAGGAGFLYAGNPVYASAVSVLVQPVGEAEINLRTEAQLARSTETATVAATLLGETGPAEGLIEAISVEPVPDTSVLIIVYEAATPQRARDGAGAVAEAYLATRAGAAEQALTERTDALRRTINDYEGRLAGVNAQIASLTPGSPQLATLTTQAATLTTQISTLSTTLDELATARVNPGRIIRQPTLPAHPVRPVPWIYLAGGAGIGVVAGVAAAVARDRLTARIGDGTDIPRRVGLPLLAQLPGDGTDASILPPREPGGRAVNRLRNEVVATLSADDRIILVTGADPGSASTLVAANLGAALARADNEVVLVGANVPELGTNTVPLSQIFDVGDIPGLTDVLTRRANLSAALQPAPRIPRLRVVTPGATASAAGLLQSETARAALHSLRRRARYVVVDAPSAAAGADAQSLAGVADVAIVVAETGRARYADLADAGRQLALMRTRLLGVVLLPQILPQPTGDGEPEAPKPGQMGADGVGDPAADSWLATSAATWADQPTVALPSVDRPNDGRAPRTADIPGKRRSPPPESTAPETPGQQSSA